MAQKMQDVPYEQYAKYTKSKIKNSTLVPIDGACHIIPLDEKGDESSRRKIEFAKSNLK